ncbi:MAG TPA: hypothetical protein VLC28_00150 [Flavitalea sp.]|nr:hypothetical protein [Flavitalea sp.]
MSRTTQIISRFPDFYRSNDSENLFYKFIGVFASMLDLAEEDLVRVMRTHWVNTADNEGSKGFDATEKGDLDKIFGLYLESLGGTVLLKQGTRRPGPDGKLDDDLYRTRILGLIQVLKNGASTRTGIIDIVAANLGIVADLPYATTAKETISIIEFLPEIVNNNAAPVSISLYGDIPVNNLSPVPAIPELRLEFLLTLPTPLLNPRITNPQTGDSIRYSGTVTPGNSLYFLSDGTGLFRGQPFIPEGRLFLPPGVSTLRLEAEVGVPEGNFNVSFFDFSQFDLSIERETGIFDSAHFDDSIFRYDTEVANLEIRYNRLFPGSFLVVIPWDIPGFSANITLTQHTLDRLVEFGLPQSIPEALQPLLNQEFETREAFFTEVAPLVATETGTIGLNQKNINQLNLFSVPAALISKLLTLLDADTGNAFFPHLQALFDALAPLKDGEKKALYGAAGILFTAGSPLEIVLRESLFTDKFARFNISPRGQIKTIVDRVKAAGVYAVIAFEKRFFEDQQLEEKLALVLKHSPYDQEMSEFNFDFASTQNTVEDQEMTESFSASGVFNYTGFDSLNTFA